MDGTGVHDSGMTRTPQDAAENEFAEPWRAARAAERKRMLRWWRRLWRWLWL
jgi:hypothetical protein